MFQKLLIFLAIAGLATSCSNSTDSPSKSPSGTEFRVALLSPGPIADNGWNASAYEGILAIKKEFGATDAQQAVKPPDIESGFRRNAQKGANLIFGHGFEFGDAALKVAKEFPETAFVVSAGGPDVVAKNVTSIVWRIEDAAYLCGRIAARISKTGKAGCVGGEDIPPVKSAFEAFTAGAVSVNPKFDVRVTYVGSWENIGAARAQTLSLIEAGCDCLIHDADAAGLGMLEAAEQKHVTAFGCLRDQTSSAPNAVLASAFVDVQKSFLDVARDVKNHTYVGKRLDHARKNGYVRLIWNEKLKATIPADVVRDAEETDAKIASGEIQIKYLAP